MKAITPIEAAKARIDSIPDEVIEIVNEMISAKYRDGRATLIQKEVANAIASRLDISVVEVFDKKMLDFEPLYEKSGWHVKYDRPAYNESYEAYWEFITK